MAVRSPRRWGTHFGRWVSGFGVPRLATSLGRAGHPTTASAIYEWVSGRNYPGRDRALEIQRLSAGQVRLEDIYAHREQVRD